MDPREDAVTQRAEKKNAKKRREVIADEGAKRKEAASGRANKTGNAARARRTANENISCDRTHIDEKTKREKAEGEPVDKGRPRRIGTREIGANKGSARARRRERDRRHRTRRRRKQERERESGHERTTRERERRSDCGSIRDARAPPRLAHAQTRYIGIMCRTHRRSSGCLCCSRRRCCMYRDPWSFSRSGAPRSAA